MLKFSTLSTLKLSIFLLILIYFFASFDKAICSGITTEEADEFHRAQKEEAEAAAKDNDFDGQKRTAATDWDDLLNQDGVKDNNRLINTESDKQLRLMTLESELQALRNGELYAATSKAIAARHARDLYYGSMPFFPSKEQKERLVLLEQEAKKQEKELALVVAKERALVRQIKPLYGIVSWRFVADQQRAMSGALSTVNEISYNNAWYSTFFALFEAESVSDLLVVFITNFIIPYIIFYPFAVIYFIFWVTPWNIYEYSSSILDLPKGLIAYVLSSLVILLPGIILLGGIYVFSKNLRVRFFTYINEQRQRRRNARQQYNSNNNSGFDANGTNRNETEQNQNIPYPLRLRRT